MLLASVSLLVIYKVAPGVRKWWRAGPVPGVPFLSCFVHIKRLQQLLKEWMEEKKAFSGWYSMWLGFDFTLLTADPEVAQWVLKNSDLTKTGVVGVPKEFIHTFGKNLLMSNGEDWKRQRSVINSGFRSEAYKGYYPTFNEVIEKCLTKFHQLPEGCDLDISFYFSKFTLDLLGKSIFHYDFNTLDSDYNPYYDAYRTIITAGGQLNRLLVEAVPGWSHFPFLMPKRFKDSTQIMKQLFKRVIEDHKQGNYNDVLDALLQSQAVDHKLSETEMYSNIWIFFAAGHETTSNALSWAFAELADKQDLQERLYEHILDVFPSGTPSIESILDPPALLNGFIKENLRHHPPVTFIPIRRTARELLCGNQIIPAGSRVGVDVWAIHHNPNHWEDPNLFDPERFLPERRRGKHKFSFLPFGLGPRQCIGNEFSEIEQRLFLVKFMREFKVLPPLHHPKADLDKLPNFGESFPVYVRLQKRE
uniref:Cytochrome P450 n=1 Tax=Arcella intermedia TaxID=1963864 RepID=A0A6B2L2R2_9EUKA